MRSRALRGVRPATALAVCVSLGAVTGPAIAQVPVAPAAPAAAPASGLAAGEGGGEGIGAAGAGLPSAGLPASDPRGGGWGWGEGPEGRPFGPPTLGGVAAGTFATPGAFGFPHDAGRQQPAASGRSYTITPSIAVDVLATDNVDQTVRNRRSDFVTTVTPGINFTVSTARLQGLLNYAPGLQYYGRDGDTQILHRGNGQFLATLVPDALFIDIRGAASTQAAQGGFAPQSSPTIDRNGLVQTTTFQISPYYVHRFGDTATAQLGYSFQSVQQNLGGGASAATTPDGQVFFNNNNFISNTLYAVARTGPDFGRLAVEGRVIATEYDGTGVLEDAYVRRASVSTRYAITRRIALLGEVGYEWLRYSGIPPFDLSEPTWGVGARLQLSDLSVVTMRYIRSGGFNSPVLDAVIALGGRTTLFANYSEILTTGAQRAADLLSTTTLDALGNPVDAQSGAPVVQPFGDSFQGAQSNLQRIRRGSVSISQVWPRDVLTLAATNERRRSVAVSPGTIAIDQDASFVTFTWSHALTPATSLIGSASFGRLDQQSFGSGDTYGGSATLVTQFTPRLTGFLQYGLTNRFDEFVSGNAVQNIVRAGLRQTF